MPGASECTSFGARCLQDYSNYDGAGNAPFYGSRTRGCTRCEDDFVPVNGTCTGAPPLERSAGGLPANAACFTYSCCRSVMVNGMVQPSCSRRDTLGGRRAYDEARLQTVFGDENDVYVQLAPTAQPRRTYRTRSG